MNKIEVYSTSGTKKGTLTLPKAYSAKTNTTLLSQAIRVYEDRLHLPLAKAKTRADVNISTRKIYRQKGTGGARHGARSAPIFVGGGVAHGPKGVKRVLSLSKAMIKRTLALALSLKVENKEIVAVDGIDSLKKTKAAALLVKKILLPKESRKVSFILSEKNWKVKKVLQNLKRTNVLNFSNLNAREVLFGGLIIIDKDVFESSVRKSKNKISK